MIKYGIVEDDIYNLDKVGYTMGLIGTTRVVTSCEFTSVLYRHHIV
jgi:hypothetical protein